MRSLALAVAAVCALCLLMDGQTRFFQPAIPQIRVSGTSTAPYRAQQRYYTAAEPVKPASVPAFQPARTPVVQPAYNGWTPPGYDPSGYYPSGYYAPPGYYPAADQVESSDQAGAGWLAAGVAALGVVSALSTGRLASLAVAEKPKMRTVRKFEGPPVSGQATAVGADKKLYSFGGRPADQSEAQVCDDLWRFDPATDSWEKLSVEGGPKRRMYAAAAATGDSILVTGGWDPAEKGTGGFFYDEVWALNVKSLTWRQLDPMPQGEASRHVAASLGDRVLIHTFRAEKAIMVYDPESDSVREQPTTGDAPQRLGMHVGVVLGSNFVVFGGNSNTAGFNEHAFALDTQTWKWSRLNVGDIRPNPIGSMCAAAANGRMVAFGGAEMGSEYNGGKGLVARGEVWELNLLWGGLASWTRLQADHISGSENAPTPRVAASLNVLPNGELLLNGGWCPSDGSTITESSILSLDGRPEQRLV